MTDQRWEYAKAEIVGPDTYRIYEWNENHKKTVSPDIEFATSTALLEGHTGDVARQIEMLNRLGAEGWEVVQAVSGVARGAFFLKRLKRS